MADPVVLSTLTAVIGMLFGYLFKSKCRHSECCYGMIQIDRDIDAERSIEEHCESLKYL